MQTNGLSSFNAASTRNTADNSFSEKPAQTSGIFGEVMHRALNNAGAKPQPGLNHSPVGHETDSESESASDAAKADRKRTTAKKSESDSSNQYVGFNGGPAVTPPPAPNQSTGNAHDAKEATGSTAAPAPDDSGKTVVTDAATTDTKATDSSTESASSGTQEPQTSATGVEHAPAAGSDVAKALAALSPEPNSDPAASADAAAIGKSDPQTGPIALTKAPAETMTVSTADPHGTSAAKQDVTMKKAEKTPKVAGQTEQDLPGITASSSEELPKGQKLSAKDALHGGEKLDSTMEVPVRVLTSNDSPAPTETVAAAAPVPGIDSRVLERTHDIVALHAMRLTDTGSDSLHVVVKPGDGIQLSLELRQSARGIEVHASLHKGDFDQLNQHWPDLQQRLEARGVRVGTLTTAENFTSSSHQQFQQSKHQSSNQDSLQAGAFAEFALAGSMAEAPAARAARAAAYRGWETWA